MSATVANLSGNVRNGELVKTGTSDFIRVEITVSRERQAGFERTLVPKHQPCFPGIDDRIFSPYVPNVVTSGIQPMRSKP